MIIGVCGCMAQKEGERLRKGRPYLDFVVGTANIWQIPDIIRRIEAERKFTYALELPEKADDELTLPRRTERSGYALKSFVPVMYGCNNFCSYCVVPTSEGAKEAGQ